MDCKNLYKKETNPVLMNDSAVKMSNISQDSDENAVEVDRGVEYIENLLGSVNSSHVNDKLLIEEKLRKKLRFHFMNPIEKWYHKQRFPYKFVVQLFKVITVTLQSCLFAHHRAAYITFMINTQFTFSHLFLQNWDSDREIMSYPPQSGDLAVYKASEFFSAIDFAVVSYANLDEAVGTFSYAKENNTVPPPILFCFSHFKECEINVNESYVFDSTVLNTCVDINVTKSGSANFSSEEYFHQKGVKIAFSSLIKANLYFGIRTVNFKSFEPLSSPDCFNFNVTVFFDNQAHDGHIKLALDMAINKIHCKGSIDHRKDTHLESIFIDILNSLVIVVCFISAVLCSRAVYKAHLLKKRTVTFFREYLNKEVSLKGKLEFLNLWYVTMIVSDVIIIIGCCLKQDIEKNEFSGDEWNVCGVLLGVGTFLIWFTILRYTGFFKSYNIVTLTVKVATPMILRFMVCTMLLYAGFVFCGWLVLGPYHLKFRTISGTSESLFALLNGDDVFDTFSTLQPTKSDLIWWFTRIYLYFFISLLIYVILPLFVSVILDAYETIKRFYAEGFPKSDIQEFIDDDMDCTRCSNSPSSSLAGGIPPCFPSFSRT